MGSSAQPLLAPAGPAFYDSFGCGRSSAVEHGVYTAGVGGSTPSARTSPPSVRPNWPDSGRLLVQFSQVHSRRFAKRYGERFARYGSTVPYVLPRVGRREAP